MTQARETVRMGAWSGGDRRGHEPLRWRTSAPSGRRPRSQVLEPVTDLLAFGLGLGATIVDKVDGLDDVEFVGTGMVATAVIF